MLKRFPRPITRLFVGLVLIFGNIIPAAPSRATLTNSFAGVDGLVSRFQPENFNVDTGVWVDSVNTNIFMDKTNNHRISENLTVVESANYEGTYGSVQSFPVVSGSIQDFIKFPTLFANNITYSGNTDTTVGSDFTIYYVARYANSTDASHRKRILTGYDKPANIAAGFHNGSVGKMYYVGDWFTDTLLDAPCYQGGNYICQANLRSQTIPNTLSTVNDWAIIGFRIPIAEATAILRTNGMTTAYENPAHMYRDTTYFGINAGDFGVDASSESNETSDFEIADYLVFGSALSNSQMQDVESQLAQRYGIALQGTPPYVPVVTDTQVGANTLRIDWAPVSYPGTGTVYGYQIRAKDTSPGYGWSYATVTNLEQLYFDYGATRGWILDDGHSYSMQVRALSTNGNSEWSDIQTLNFVGPSKSTALQNQSGPKVPTKIKRGKTLKFGMTVSSGLALTVSSSGTCKTAAQKKKVSEMVTQGSKMRRIKVKRQVGWAVKMTKRGTCTLKFTNSGDASHKALDENSIILVTR